MAVIIITGAPGVGKSSLAHLLADEDASGVHLETDTFFRFLRHRIDPSSKEAHAQNETVVAAYTRAAAEYSLGGYNVYMDGVIGPWMLPLITPILGAFDYVLLSAPLELALTRARVRDGQDSATPAVIRIMHEQFTRILSEFRGHVLDTSERSPAEVAAEYRSRNAAGAYSLGQR